MHPSWILATWTCHRTKAANRLGRAAQWHQTVGTKECERHSNITSLEQWSLTSLSTKIQTPRTWSNWHKRLVCRSVSFRYFKKEFSSSHQFNLFLSGLVSKRSSEVAAECNAPRWRTSNLKLSTKYYLLHVNWSTHTKQQWVRYDTIALPCPRRNAQHELLHGAILRFILNGFAGQAVKLRQHNRVIKAKR